MGPTSMSFRDQTRRFQAELLRSTLDEVNWNIAEAARRLEIARSHLYSLIRSFGLSRVGRVNGVDSAPGVEDPIPTTDTAMHDPIPLTRDR